MDHLKRFDCSDMIGDLDITMMGNMKDSSVDSVALVNEDGDTVCLAGVSHKRIGVGEVWVIRSELINNYKFEFFKTIRGLIDFLHTVMGLHRIELAILCTWKGGDKWAQAIGFEYESIAKAYDFRFNDHAIYTKIKRGE